MSLKHSVFFKDLFRVGKFDDHQYKSVKNCHVFLKWILGVNCKGKKTSLAPESNLGELHIAITETEKKTKKTMYLVETCHELSKLRDFNQRVNFTKRL